MDSVGLVRRPVALDQHVPDPCFCLVYMQERKAMDLVFHVKLGTMSTHSPKWGMCILSPVSIHFPWNVGALFRHLECPHNKMPWDILLTDAHVLLMSHPCRMTRQVLWLNCYSALTNSPCLFHTVDVKLLTVLNTMAESTSSLCQTRCSFMTLAGMEPWPNSMGPGRFKLLLLD